MKWSYGATTCWERVNTLLPSTIDSLKNAGFDKPVLFMDGDLRARDYEYLRNRFPECEIATRSTTLNITGNWILALHELYIRNPHADRYAIFQDDIKLVRGLKDYLSKCEFPNKSYANLYTFPQNHKKIISHKKGWYEASRQGLGALGLVFDRRGIQALLGHPHFVKKLTDKHDGWRRIDGGIVEAMRKMGIKEFVHNPSLVQHSGQKATTKKGIRTQHPLAPSFPGEEFDATTILQGKQVLRGGRIGLVGYNDPINNIIVDNVDVDIWLLKPQPQKPLKSRDERCDVIACRMGQQDKIERFVTSVDIVVFCNTNYYRELVPMCRKHKRLSFCILTEPITRVGGWTKQVDHYLCYTEEALASAIKHKLPCAKIPVPDSKEKGDQITQIMRHVAKQVT